MGGEGVVDVGHAALSRHFRHLERRSDAADATAIDLDKFHLTEIHQVPRYGDIMGRLTARDAYLRAFRGKCRIGLERMT